MFATSLFALQAPDFHARNHFAGLITQLYEYTKSNIQTAWKCPRGKTGHDGN